MCSKPDDEDVASPNFPTGLSIVPSMPPLIASVAASAATALPDHLLASIRQEEAIQRYGIAGRVWEAAYAMIMYAAPTADWSHDPPFVDASTEPVLLIELGSGTGLVALEIARTLARAGRPATIVMTDLPEVCPLLEETAKEPLHVAGSDSALVNETTLAVHQLAWGDAVHADDLQAMLAQLPRIDRGITHILCSDLVYFPELLAPLLRTLLQLTVAHDPVLVISYKVRSLAKESAFWSALGLWFSYGPVLTRRAASLAVDSLAEDWSRFGAAWDEPMFVFVGRRRPESRAWTVPYDNRELLDGIGARGTNTRKGDDTFETLLFMALQEDP